MGSTEQTKIGNLIVEGVLRLGQFASAPAGTEGALYFDTTENTTKIYSNSAWGDLGGGAEPGQLPTYTTAERDTLSPSAGLMIYNTDYDQVQTYTQTAWSGITGSKDLGIECASAMDCASGFCVDTVCCDTSSDNCNGDCEACNLAGTIGYCTVRANLDNTEVTTTCYYCNGTGDTSIGYTGNTGVNCTGINGCNSGTCQNSYCDEDNDSHYSTAPAVCASGRYSFTIGDDCDESCSTCYPGSVAYTVSPDGLDQDCDGNIDSTAGPAAAWSACIPAIHCNTHCANELTDSYCIESKGWDGGIPMDPSCWYYQRDDCNSAAYGLQRVRCHCGPKYH